jgi:hypothetical protein
MNRQPPQPPRLRETAAPGSPLARGLDHARARQPTSEQVRAIDRRLFGTLGALGAAAAVGSSAVGSASAAPLAATVLASAPTVTATGLAAAAPAVSLKLGLALAVTVVGAGGGAIAWRTTQHHAAVSVNRAVTHPSRPASPPAAPAPAPTPPPELVPATATAPVPIPQVAQAPVPAVVPPPRSAPATAPPPLSAPLARRAQVRANTTLDSFPGAGPQAVEAEIRLIESARARVVSDPARALQLCLQHDQTFPDGVMREEREAIAVSALIALGRHSEALEHGARFLSGHPASPYGPSLREQLRSIDSR